jgi:hypothetical protein
LFISSMRKAYTASSYQALILNFKRCFGAKSIPLGKCPCLLYGARDKRGESSFTRHSVTAKISSGPGEQVEMITVDAFVERYHLSVGFLKADVEEHGWPVVKGAAKIISRQARYFPLQRIMISQRCTMCQSFYSSYFQTAMANGRCRPVVSPLSLRCHYSGARQMSED